MVALTEMTAGNRSHLKHWPRGHRLVRPEHGRIGLDAHDDARLRRWRCCWPSGRLISAPAATGKADVLGRPHCADFVVKVFWSWAAREREVRDSSQTPLANGDSRETLKHTTRFYQLCYLSDAGAHFTTKSASFGLMHRSRDHSITSSARTSNEGGTVVRYFRIDHRPSWSASTRADQHASRLFAMTFHGTQAETRVSILIKHFQPCLSSD